jgi:hypothetical protein
VTQSLRSRLGAEEEEGSCDHGDLTLFRYIGKKGFVPHVELNLTPGHTLGLAA